MFFFLSLNLTSTVLLFWNKNKHLHPYLLQVNERFASSCSSKKSAISKVESCSYYFFFLGRISCPHFRRLRIEKSEKNWVKKVNIFSDTRLYRKTRWLYNLKEMEKMSLVSWKYIRFCRKIEKHGIIWAFAKI